MPSATPPPSSRSGQGYAASGLPHAWAAEGDGRRLALLHRQSKALEHSEELFDVADISKDGKLQLSELRWLLRKSSEEYSHFAEHARFLEE